MINTLTTKNYTHFIAADKDAGIEGVVQTTSLLSGLSPEKIRKMPSKKRITLTNELYAQMVSPTKPVMMVQYKGKVFAYAPCEVGTLDEMTHATKFIADKSYHLLNHLMFREVKTVYRWMHRGGEWEQECGLKIKRFKNFENDIQSYECKPLKTLDSVDLSFWNDFPIAFTLKAVDFSLGTGLAFAARATEISSPTQMQALQIHLQSAILGSRLLTTSQQMKKLYSVSQECKQFGKFPSYKYLTGGLTSAISKSKRKLDKVETVDFAGGLIAVADKINNNKLPFVALETLDKVFVGIGSLNKFTWQK